MGSTYASLSCRFAYGGSLSSSEHRNCCRTAIYQLRIPRKLDIHCQTGSGKFDSLTQLPLTTTPEQPPGSERPPTTALCRNEYAAKNHEVIVGLPTHMAMRLALGFQHMPNGQSGEEEQLPDVIQAAAPPSNAAIGAVFARLSGRVRCPKNT